MAEFVRGSLFLFLHWLRTPVRGIHNAVLIACTVGLATGVFGYAPFDRWTWQVAIFLISLGTFISRWFYDALLIKLAPRGTIIGERFK